GRLGPREGCIGRRGRGGPRRIVLPDGGLTLCHYGYAENLAHAVLCAVDRPDAAAGEIFHCGDEEVLTLRQVVEVVAAALGHRFEIVSLPWELARPARPLVAQPLPTHRVLDLSKLKGRLGYRHPVPARRAPARTPRRLDANPPAPGGQEELVLQDPFDYAAEDALALAFGEALAAMPPVRFAREPGYTLAYSGPGGRARSQPDFEP